MNWRQAIPTSVTLMAMLAGFLSILITVQGMVSDDNPGKYYSWSAQLIMLAMILDGLDGNLARWLKGMSEFGAELDTYVDLTAFGIAPAVLVFAVTMQGRDPVWRALLPSAVAISGVVRLARFKVADPLRGQGGYGGLPITVNAAWVALFVFITLTPPRDVFSLNEGPAAVTFLSGIIVFIILQVSSLRYPKPTKKVVLFVPCIILVCLLWLLDQYLASRVAMIMILMGGGYVVIGPMFVKGMAVHKAKKDAMSDKGNEDESELDS